MPKSAITTFTNPYAFQAAIAAADVKAVSVAPGAFRATLVSVELSRLSVQRGSENLARTVTLRVKPELSQLFFLEAKDQPPMLHNGAPLLPGEIAVLQPGSLNYQRSSAACEWGAVSLAPGALARTWAIAMGCDMPVPEVHIARPSRARWLQFLGLCKTAQRLATSAPALLAHPEVARGLQSRLEHAVAMCLAPPIAERASLASCHHRLVMQRLEDVAEACPAQPLSLREICALIGVPERTLRISCSEHLGMGPIRYLWLRRMHQARCALELADPARTTVTAVATDHGFWELGRFSVAYRMLFGETPSAALHRCG
jgi:AraC-like DNA-binding protein